MTSAGFNVLYWARSNDALVRGLAEQGHSLVPFFSLNDFSNGAAVLLDADIIVADMAVADPAIIEVWRSLGEGRPPLVAVGANASLVRQSDLLVLPSSVAVATVDACARLLVENRRSFRRLNVLQTQIGAQRQQMRRALELFIPRQSLDDPALRWWVDDSDDIQGELLLASRAPTGVLNVMTLEGSLNALPIITPFYRMTEKGFGVEAILGEMNTRLLRLHPDGFPLPATLVSVNFKAGITQVWHSGGIAPLLIGKSSRTAPLVARRQAPMGTADASFRPEPEIWPVRLGDRLFLCSPGLMAALDTEVHQPDVADRLTSLLPMVSAGQNPLATLMGAQKMLAVVDCSSAHGGVCGEDRPSSGTEKTGGRAKDRNEERWALSLAIGPNEMRQVDMVPMLLNLVTQLGPIEQRAGHVFLILAELYNNALDHGVLKLDSDLKRGPDGMASYLEERSRRLAALASGRVEIELKLDRREGKPCLWIVCRDSGSGFDHRQVRGRTVGTELNTLPFGRGLSLVESEASFLDFNDAGNEVTVCLSLAASRASSAT